MPFAERAPFVPLIPLVLLVVPFVWPLAPLVMPLVPLDTRFDNHGVASSNMMAELLPPKPTFQVSTLTHKLSSEMN